MTTEALNMSARQRPSARRNDGVAMIDAVFGDEVGWADAVARAEVDCDVAQAIFALRERHGLTQKALAARVRTTQSVVARLEDSSYTGHSLRMLVRIAAAVGERVTVGFVPDAEGSQRNGTETPRKTAKVASRRKRQPSRQI